jgi:hypothetical protein
MTSVEGEQVEPVPHQHLQTLDTGRRGGEGHPPCQGTHVIKQPGDEPDVECVRPRLLPDQQVPPVVDRQFCSHSIWKSCRTSQATTVFEHRPPVGSMSTRTLLTSTPKLSSQAASSVNPSALVATCGPPHASRCRSPCAPVGSPPPGGGSDRWRCRRTAGHRPAQCRPWSQLRRRRDAAQRISTLSTSFTRGSLPAPRCAARRPRFASSPTSRR